MRTRVKKLCNDGDYGVHQQSNGENNNVGSVNDTEHDDLKQQHSCDEYAITPFSNGSVDGLDRQL